jgi:polysaccharide deacetylase family protein (PEP-CTERM system associated)
MRNALSVDVEEWFQVGALERVIAPDDWDNLESRVAYNTGLVLDLFAEAGVKATFFTLGWVATRNPKLVRRIVDAGHEIASHGWDHQRIFTMTPEEFRADIVRARAALEDAAGVGVTGYRAPSFSLDQRSAWAHEVLAEEGYTYSSSVAPIRHDHYGWPEAPRFAYRPLADSPLVELPVTTAYLGRKRFAAGGGGFFRLYPYMMSRWAIRQVNHHDGRPAVFYFHPWEVDPDQPYIHTASLKSKLRHYSRLAAMAGTLRRLTGAFAWDRVDRVVADQLSLYARPERSPLALAAE